jgi:hypothetical protein
MTFPARPAHTREPDPLTDSAIHRLGLGTQVRLHLYGGDSVDCGLLDIRDVTNWDDLEARIVRGMALSVRGARRYVLAGGSIMWAEVTSDPPAETHIWPTGGTALGTGWNTGKNERP